MPVIKCLLCGKDKFYRSDRIKQGNGKFCSIQCSSRFRKKLIIKQCLICNKKFIVHNYRKNNAKFCSMECYGKSKIGYIPWNKNKKMSLEYIEMNRKCHLGIKHSENEKKNMKRIAKERGYGKWMVGKITPIKTRKKISKSLKGKNGPGWIDGRTSENQKIRNNVEIRLWREGVFARDNWTCQKCKIRGGILQAHHIRNFGEVKELRTFIENGITFCKTCHDLFHKIYGYKNNNQEQIDEFINKK